VSPFRQTAQERLFEGFIVAIDRLHFTSHLGASFDREIVRHPGAVAVVPVDDQGQVVLIRQFRASVGAPILEITAGTCDVTGEDLEATARRELVEEVGLEARRLELLGIFMNSPGYCDQRTHVFLATGLTDVGRAPEGPEEVEATVERLDLGEAVSMVLRGDLIDGTTAYGVLMAARHYGR